MFSLSQEETKNIVELFENGTLHFSASALDSTFEMIPLTRKSGVHDKKTA